MAKPSSKFSVRTILLIITIILVGFVVYQNWPDIIATIEHLPEANFFILLLLIPEQLFMYYACGQIFFSYIRQAKSSRQILRVSTELNFVNHALPAGGIGGLGFLTFRLRPFGVSAGQSSFLYIFRYTITTIINYLQALLAVIILFALGQIPSSAMWVVPIALIMNVGVFIGLAMIVFVASSQKRIDFFSKIITKIANKFIQIITFGRQKSVVNYAKINHYLSDIHDSVLLARREKSRLVKPALWGFVYSFCEIGTYYIVAISLGRPALLPFIMIGEAIGSVFDGIVPYGLYELGMAGVMIALGVDFATATIVTVMTRVITLLFTIVTGYLPYRQTIMKGNYHHERSA